MLHLYTNQEIKTGGARQLERKEQQLATISSSNVPCVSSFKQGQCSLSDPASPTAPFCVNLLTQPSPVDQQPSLVDQQPSLVDQQPSPVDQQPSPVDQQPSLIFLGGLTHFTTCSQCGQSTGVDGSFWTLNLTINNDSTGDYNVEDGLKTFFSKSTFTGDNQLYCDHCEAKADATTECKLDKHPEVLVLLLKRFEFDYNLMEYVINNRPVDVPLTIEIPQHYELYATVNHHGDLRGGQYTATIKPPDDGNGSWYTFNDSCVTLEKQT
ncbi:hypothetical protein CRUP_017892 [Coryphaenoides rupestris]|nr:hypothetical protein CRUP_017892 [Coryphaenoides rupestris]